MPVGELMTPYKDRPENSESKLRTYSDGFRILKCISSLIKEEKPLPSCISFFFAILSFVFFYPVLVQYLESGNVPRFPTAILCSVLMLLSFLSLFSGIILDTQAKARKELKRLFYLAVSGTSHENEEKIVTEKNLSGSSATKFMALVWG